MVVYFSLGTNLGDKEQNLRMAVQKIRKQIGEVISLSAFYATAPWGFSSDNTFLNAALCVVRIVHNGGEEVDRLDDGDLVGDAVHGGVVAAVVAD